MKNIKQLFAASFFFLLIVPVVVNAQQNDTLHIITGIIKDAVTRDRIANAAISVPGTQIGTVSNSEGEFIIKIPKSYKEDYFEISHISYKKQWFSISKSSGKRIKIKLHPESLKLNEITVFPKDARKLVELAFRNVRKNYGSKPNNMIGFYRESIKQRRHYISISEAVVDIYKASYSNFRSDQVGIYKGRKGLNVKKADTLMVQLQGGPKVILWLDVAKNPNLGVDLIDFDKYNFSFESFVKIDDEVNYIINFEPSGFIDEIGFFGKIYIEQNSYAISRMEFRMDLSDRDRAAQLFIKKKPMGIVFYPLSTNYLVTYKKQDEQFYLNYIRIELKFKSDWRRKLFKNRYTIVSELAITDRKEVDVEKIPRKNRFRSSMIMSEELKSFEDRDFWGDYNIIEPEESIEKAIKRIMKKMR